MALTTAIVFFGWVIRVVTEGCSRRKRVREDAGEEGDGAVPQSVEEFQSEVRWKALDLVIGSKSPEGKRAQKEKLWGVGVRTRGKK